jgi:NDP-sugar pyrophosphorylase family protein
MSGASLRFRNAGYEDPKPFLKVKGREILWWVLDQFKQVDKTILILSRALPHANRTRLQEIIDQSERAIEILEIDPHRLGPSHAVYQAGPRIDPNGEVVVSYCDFYSLFSEQYFWDRLSNCDALIGSYTGFHPHMSMNTRYAYMRRLLGGYVAEVREKAAFTPLPTSEEASCGWYAVAKGQDLFDALDWQFASDRSTNGEFYLSECFNYFTAEKRKLDCLNVTHFCQWGTPEDYEYFVAQMDLVQRALRQMGRSLDHFEKLSDVQSRPTLICLAAGSGRRFTNAGYEVPKHRLPILGVTCVELAESSVRTAVSKLRVVREIESSAEDSLEDRGSQIPVRQVQTGGPTQGQAASAFIALGAVEDSDGPIVILACDSCLLDIGEFEPEVNYILVSRPNREQLANPKESSWAVVDDCGRVIDVMVKPESIGGSELRLVGGFVFADLATAREASNLWKDIDHHHSEVYLDDVFKAMVGNHPVAAMNVDVLDFGSPFQYENVRYFHSLNEQMAK